MAFNGGLLVLLLACFLLVPTLARNLDIPQRSFVRSEDANREFSHLEEGRIAGLFVSKKQGPTSETGHAKGVSISSVLYHQTGHEAKSALHPKPELSFDDKVMSLPSFLHEEETSLPYLSHAEGISVSLDKEISSPSLSRTEENLLHESDLVLRDDDTIPSLLDQNGLPIGLLPSSVASYSITDDGDFTVSLQKACYVKFDYEVYYAETITGKLTYGTITNLSGIQAKEAFFWVPVTGIRTDIPSSDYIYFDVGPISKKLSISQFQTIRVCKAKAMAFSALA